MDETDDDTLKAQLAEALDVIAVHIGKVSEGQVAAVLDRLEVLPRGEPLVFLCDFSDGQNALLRALAHSLAHHHSQFSVVSMPGPRKTDIPHLLDLLAERRLMREAVMPHVVMPLTVQPEGEGTPLLRKSRGKASSRRYARNKRYGCDNGGRCPPFVVFRRR